eukprot:TRINITY_DN63_c7_g1_i1.p1 TRINITY_DN63_c7_g1~~TRINITY_DN63_c7_g1_i1.p1  ORF type:complete len:455 (+),score=35.56 TRINITY_DN63_c7_g1_i1:88-1365(+)
MRKNSCKPPPKWEQLHATKGICGRVTNWDEGVPFNYSEWQDTPPPRTKFTTVEYNNKMIIFGGGYQRTFHGDLYEHDLSLQKWRCIDQDVSLVGGPSHRRSHKVVLYNDEMILFGGRLVYGKRNDVFVLNLKTYKWTNKTPSPEICPQPVERAAHSAVLWDHKMVVFGGDEDASGSSAYLSDLWMLDLKTFTWKLCSPTGTLPTGRLGHDCAMSGDTMYLFGGYQGRALNDMYSINLSQGIWRVIGHEVVVRPTSFLCMLGRPDGRKTDLGSPTCSGLLIWGGAFTDTDTYTNTLYNFNIKSESFEAIEVAGTKPTARLGHAMLYHKNFLYLFGGCDSSYYNDLYKLDLNPPSLLHTMRCFLRSEGVPYKDSRKDTRAPSRRKVQSFRVQARGSLCNPETKIEDTSKQLDNIPSETDASNALCVD